MNKFVFLLLLSFLITGPQAWAQEACQGLFGRDLFASHHLEEVGSGKTIQGLETVLVARKSYETRSLLGRRKTMVHEWSDFKKNPDVPGDVRWGLEFLPENLRLLFGVQGYDKNNQKTSHISDDLQKIAVPTPLTVRHVIASLESRVRQQDPHFGVLNFYETNGQTFEGRAYLQAIAAKKEMPMARQGHLFEHDLNYHVYSSLILPPYVLKAVQNRIGVVLGFIKYVETHHPTATSLLRKLDRDGVNFLVEAVDASTGNLFLITVPSNKGQKISEVMSEVQFVIDTLFGGKTNAHDFFEKFVSLFPLNKMEMELVKTYADGLGADLRRPDLPAHFLENPSILYNDAREQLHRLDRAAQEIIQNSSH